MSEYIEIEPGVRVFAQIEGEGKPIVLVHGWALNHEMWKYQVPYLKNHGYQVVAIDLRGFGDSDKPHQRYTYKTWADDLGKVIEALNLQNATLVGYSIGGAIAMYYITTRADPRVEKLVLVSAAGPYMTCSLENMADHWACFGRDPIFFDGLVFLIVNQKDEYAIRQFYNNMLLGMEPEDFQWIQRMLQSGSPEALVGGLEEMRDKDLRDNLREVSVPTRIVSGLTDTLVPVALAEVQHRLIAGATLTHLQAGHGLFFEQKDQLNRELAW